MANQIEYMKQYGSAEPVVESESTEESEPEQHGHHSPERHNGHQREEDELPHTINRGSLEELMSSSSGSSEDIQGDASYENEALPLPLFDPPVSQPDQPVEGIEEEEAVGATHTEVVITEEEESINSRARDKEEEEQ